MLIWQNFVYRFGKLVELSVKYCIFRLCILSLSVKIVVCQDFDTELPLTNEDFQFYMSGLNLRLFGRL